MNVVETSGVSTERFEHLRVSIPFKRESICELDFDMPCNTTELMAYNEVSIPFKRESICERFWTGMGIANMSHIDLWRFNSLQTGKFICELWIHDPFDELPSYEV